MPYRVGAFSFLAHILYYMEKNEIILQHFKAAGFKKTPLKRNRSMSEFEPKQKTISSTSRCFSRPNPSLQTSGPWCGPWQSHGTGASLAKTYNSICLTKCDVDSSTTVAERYGLRSTPTLMTFQGGKVIHSITEMHPRVLSKMLSKRPLRVTRYQPRSS